MAQILIEQMQHPKAFPQSKWSDSVEVLYNTAPQWWQ